MPAVKPGAQVAAKWSRVAAQRTEDYQMGVAAPRTPWAAASRAAEDRYKQGVADAASRGAFGKGVAAAGDARWQSKATAKGPTRYAEGVQLSGADYASGVQPYLDAIAATQLPPRYPKGDPRNVERVRVMSQALRKRKTG
jgi:hypothetical protein